MDRSVCVLTPQSSWTRLSHRAPVMCPNCSSVNPPTHSASHTRRRELRGLSGSPAPRVHLLVWLLKDDRCHGEMTQRSHHQDTERNGKCPLKNGKKATTRDWQPIHTPREAGTQARASSESLGDCGKMSSVRRATLVIFNFLTLTS